LLEVKSRPGDDAGVAQLAHPRLVDRASSGPGLSAGDQPEALNDVLEALEERLHEDEAYVDLEQAPLRETVERLCADLELTPDWSRWEGEGWTAQAPFHRPRASIWARPSRTPLRPHDDAGQTGAPLAHRRE
jgi:hypothetical protein